MAAFTYARIYNSGTGTWSPGIVKRRAVTTLNSDERQAVVSGNQLLYALNNLLAYFGGADVPMNTAIPTIGTTVTIATPTQFIGINGVNGSIAAETAKAFGSLGTIPTTKWGLIALERIANGTTTFVSAAANYTTGYATEALAIAAIPAQSADKVMTGFVTIYASHASGWVAGTDALAGGTGGNPAGTTNYYGIEGCADAASTPWAACYQIGNEDGVVFTTAAG